MRFTDNRMLFNIPEFVQEMYFNVVACLLYHPPQLTTLRYVQIELKASYRKRLLKGL